LNSDASLDGEPDAALVARYAAVRDEEAFRELVRRHGPMVLCTCARMLRHRHDAEDAFQAVFLVLAAKRRALRHVRSLGGWLHSVAIRVSYGMLRSNRRRELRLAAISNEHPEAEEDGRVRELEEVLDEELAALPAKYREALILCDLEGHTREEAARQLNTSGSAIAKRVTRGRTLLRDRLVRRGVTFGASGLAAALAHGTATGLVLHPRLINETLRIADLFLLGARVSGVPAVAKITSVAQGELNRMFLTKLSTTIGIAALAIVVWLGASPASKVVGLLAGVQAGTVLFDDFNDGSATDGNPATWIPFPGFSTPSFISAASGDYVLTQPNEAPQVTYPNIAPLGATSIRAQVRELQGGGPISLLARFNTVGIPAGYQAGIEPGGLYIVRTNAPFNNTDLASAVTNLNPSIEDIILQFDLIGSRLSLFA
jgi:RNA polymerase sigma factor (sigma-70 family)